MDRRIVENLMQLLGLDEVLDHLANASNVCWYGHVLRREDDDVLEGHFILRSKAGEAFQDMDAAGG